MNEPYTPELTPSPQPPRVPIGDFARIVSVHDKEKGVRLLLRLQHDITDLADRRQRLLCHLTQRAVMECRGAVEKMTQTDVTLALAKMKNGVVPQEGNGEPPHTEALS